MQMRYLSLLSFLALFLFLGADSAPAFQGPGCMADCTSCHTITKDEAAKLLKTDKFGARITDIRMSPVKGLWQVEIHQGPRKFIVYIDFAKKFLVEGRFTPLEKIGKPPTFKKVDLEKIPLDKALVFGDPGAEKRIIVFDDPDCPYCKRLHGELKKILKERKDIVFYIKLYPLAIHPKAYDRARTIVCKRSVELLEDAFKGKKLPEPEGDCGKEEVDANIKLAKELGIGGTPAIILPDGRMVPGYVTSEVLLRLLDSKEHGPEDKTSTQNEQ